MTDVRFKRMHELWGAHLGGDPVRLTFETRVTQASFFKDTTRYLELDLPTDVRDWIRSQETAFANSTFATKPFQEVGDRVDVKLNQSTRAFCGAEPLSLSNVREGDPVRVDVEWVGVSTRYAFHRSLFTLKALVVIAS